ncbi:hypothetical protein ACFPRL_30130 [Pseudoclavibacter helvolus]
MSLASSRTCPCRRRIGRDAAAVDALRGSATTRTSARWRCARLVWGWRRDVYRFAVARLRAFRGFPGRGAPDMRACRDLASAPG